MLRIIKNVFQPTQLYQKAQIFPLSHFYDVEFPQLIASNTPSKNTALISFVSYLNSTSLLVPASCISVALLLPQHLLNPSLY